VARRTTSFSGGTPRSTAETRRQVSPPHFLYQCTPNPPSARCPERRARRRAPRGICFFVARTSPAFSVCPRRSVRAKYRTDGSFDWRSQRTPGSSLSNRGHHAENPARVLLTSHSSPWKMGFAEWGEKTPFVCHSQFVSPGGLSTPGEGPVQSLPGTGPVPTWSPCPEYSGRTERPCGTN
jgi:hypothetical protein